MVRIKKRICIAYTYERGDGKKVEKNLTETEVANFFLDR